MIGAAGAIGVAAESENDDADRTSDRAKDRVVRRRHAVGILDKSLGILQAGRTERGIDVDRDAATGTASDKLGIALITRPLWGDRDVLAQHSWCLRIGGGLDGV